MKKLLTLLLLHMAATAFAQTEKANLMVGAGIGNMGGSGTNGFQTFSINVYPRIGYFVAPRVAVGATAHLGGSFQRGLTNLSYGLTPFSRYYFSSARTAFFVEGFAGVSGYSASGSTLPRRQSGKNFMVGAGPGIAYFITPNVGLEGLLTGSYYSIGDNAYSWRTLNFSVGMQVYLNTKRSAKKAQPAMAEPADGDDE